MGDPVGLDVESMSMQELLDLNARVLRRHRYLRALRDRALLDRLVVGEHVSFFRGHYEVIGPVVRVNRKTVTVRDEDDGRLWLVSPGRLTRMPWIKSGSEWIRL